ncbi:hypothetical protein YS110_20060 [Acidovorax sp. YS12]|nr:hypothetical protein YS110_20060 [Acidovorax sp. YS12]
MPLPLYPAALLAAALALAPWRASAQAEETLEGQLERGPTHSVLWFVSPESGDLIGQVFANASQAGQVILARCLPGLACVAEGAHTTEPDEALLPQLRFADRPSGWWLITQVQNAFMQPSLPLEERALRTRQGELRITDEHLLLLEGRPVLANPQPACAHASAPAPAPAAAPPTLLERLAAWWNGLRRKLLALLGRTSASAPPATATPAAPDRMPWQIPGTAEAVQGNAALHIAAHYELENRDIVLLQDTGGTLCPALYRFVTLTAQGITVTPEFGSCSDIATATLEKAPDGTPMPLVTMNGFFGPFEPEAERQRAHMQLHRFTLRNGAVEAIPAED